MPSVKRKEAPVKNMANCRSINFDIAVHGHTPPYAVRATYGPLAAEGLLEVDSRDAFWVDRLSWLDPVGAPPGPAILADTGARLFQALFRERVRELWLRAQADLASGTVDAIRLRLSLTPAPVAALPWEALQDPDAQTPFVVRGQTPVVRVANLLGSVGAVRSLAAQLPLRLLVALPADPSGQIDGAVEKAAIQAALAPLQPEGVATSIVDGQVGLLDLRSTLAEHRPDILHIVTHGQPEGLLLWSAGQPVLVSGRALCAVLAEAPSLRLTVLNACASGQMSRMAGDHAPSTALGAQLLQTGIPAVVAMQFAVGATAARQFSEVFYQELLVGRCPGQIDAAMSAARGSLYLVDQTTFSYGTPVLWLNAPDGRIFTADRPLRLRPVAVMPSPPTLAELADLAAQVDAVRTWLANQPDLSRATTNAILRNLVNQQQERLRMVGDLLDQISTHPGTRAELASAAAKLSAIREHRRAADRLTDLIQANQEPPSG